MRRTLTIGLALLLGLTILGGPAAAQDEPAPSPSPSTSELPVETGDTVESDGSQAVEGLDPVVEPGLAFEDPVWRRVDADGRSPAGREDHTWTVDGDGRYAYLFGGRDGAREFGDLWRYDLESDRWKKLSPRGRGPEPRFGHSAVWVDGSGVVVFAGQQGDDFFADLWAYDPERDRWTRLPGNGQAPKRRYGSCMVVGSDGRLWISHGFTSSGRFDDTRAYNLNTQRWASVAPDARRPGERCLHDCFTAADGSLVLYGGQDDGAFALGDLWVMGRDRDWTRLDDPRPAPRRLYGVAEAGAHAWIFGGAGERDQDFDDLWRVDRETLDFQRVRVDGTRPSARFAPTLIADAERGRLVLFGGQARTARSDVWELVDRAPQPAASDVPEVSPSPLP